MSSSAGGAPTADVEPSPYTQAKEQAARAIDQLPPKDNKKGILIKTNQHGWVYLVYIEDIDARPAGWKAYPEKPTSELTTETNTTSQVKEALDQLIIEEEKIDKGSRGSFIETNKHGWLEWGYSKDPSNGDGWQRNYLILE